MWPFKPKKQQHKIQVTRTTYTCNHRDISEEVVKKTDNGLVYFCMKRYGCHDKIFIKEDGTVDEPDNSNMYLGHSHKFIPLTWPIDKPCPLFEETT